MESSSDKSSARYLLYGGLAGMISRTMTAPIERAKIIQQCCTAENVNLGVHPRSHMWTIIKQLARDEGIVRGLWKGNLLNALRVVPSNAIKYTFFDVYQKQYQQRVADGSRFWKRLVCGSLAGVTATLGTYPLDMIRLRWTVQRPQLRSQYPSLWKTAVHLLKEEGPLVFYKGGLLTCVGLVPYISANFAIYGGLMDRFAPSGRPTVAQSLLIGGASGALAMMVTFPCDPIHKRLIIDGYRGEPGHFPSVWAIVKKIAATEGWRGFFRGWLPSFFKVIPSQAMSWTVIETCRRLFDSPPS